MGGSFMMFCLSGVLSLSSSSLVLVLEKEKIEDENDGRGRGKQGNHPDSTFGMVCARSRTNERGCNGKVLMCWKTRNPAPDTAVSNTQCQCKSRRRAPSLNSIGS